MNEDEPFNFCFQIDTFHFPRKLESHSVIFDVLNLKHNLILDSKLYSINAADACRNVSFSCRTWLGSVKLSSQVGLTGYQVGVGNT